VCVNMRVWVGEKNRKTSIRGRINIYRYARVCVCVRENTYYIGTLARSRGEEDVVHGEGPPSGGSITGGPQFWKDSNGGWRTARVTFKFFFLIKYYRNSSDRLWVFYFTGKKSLSSIVLCCCLCVCVRI